jgi:hypothetical protein
MREKSDANPISPTHRLRDAPRCHATAKRTGERCKCPAVRGWRVCRVHGAGGGHKAGLTHPQWKHGGRSREVAELRRALREFLTETDDAL